MMAAVMLRDCFQRRLMLKFSHVIARSVNGALGGRTVEKTHAVSPWSFCMRRSLK